MMTPFFSCVARDQRATYVIGPMASLSEMVYHASNNITKKQDGEGLLRLYMYISMWQDTHILDQLFIYPF